MQAVIMAGGKGTRLLSITNDEIPKPMAPVNGKPILQWQIECLQENGIHDITIVTGHLGEKIEEFFGGGEKFGVRITYFKEQQPLGTAGAFYFLKDQLESEYFLLIFGDVIFDVDIDRMERFHRDKKSMATLFVHPNSHPYDSDLVILDPSCKIKGFDSKNNKRDDWYSNCVNAGFYILNREICCQVQKSVKTDLEKDILMPLVERGGAVYAYRSPEYIKDVGTPERMHTAAGEIVSGYVASRNLKKKQKCIFLDRDGTINRYKGLIYREDQFELEDCAPEAIKKINQSGYLAIVITNQPVVARGLCDISDIEKIHQKMSTLLGKDGVFLDDIMFCPHHPDKGYPGENPLYKIQCACRKPKTGLIDACVEKYNIDLASSWMIGDTTMDIQTGKNAGMKTVLVRTGEAGNDRKYPVEPDFIGKDLLDAVNLILQK
ncbi:HAD-IIIA family hydrolase [Caproiciproducens sp.]|uniref:HAD-IIIA family hydrolase n=1 Tax=Caproiciproducens sp. TaxID=1954376 RepID=UPI00289BF60C|nr:HAD-IIIA family hydrolase [Caproiciproducens sp.]